MKPRALLLASVSALALVAASPQARAADVSVMPLKAPPLPEPQWAVWVEGGAFKSSGDPYRILFPTSTLLMPGPGAFEFKPSWDWQGAAGFDYHVAGSPWHVSGQVRYGQGKDSGAFAGARNLSIMGATIALAQTAAGTEKETHGLADFAVGRDFNIGGATVQAKAGVRVAELTAQASAISNTLVSISGVPLTFYGATFTSASALYNYANQQKSRFLGVGPRAGLEGTVPLGGGWEFNWLGDVALLWGRRTLDQANATTATITFFPGPVVFVPPPVTSTMSFARDVLVPNADAQLGFSYWVSRNVKLSVSYRVDAFFNALWSPPFIREQGVLTPAKVSRIDHGPLAGLTVRF
jgi:hypothetical protein